MAEQTTTPLSAEDHAKLQKMLTEFYDAIGRKNRALAAGIAYDIVGQQVIEALLAENAAMREIVQAMAALDIEYRDEHLEFFCPACEAFVSADWGTGRKPFGMTGHQWAEHRIKHEADCPVVKARTLLAAPEGEA